MQLLIGLLYFKHFKQGKIMILIKRNDFMPQDSKYNTIINRYTQWSSHTTPTIV